MTREEILKYCELVGYKPPKSQDSATENAFEMFKDLFGESDSNPFKEQK